MENLKIRWALQSDIRRMLDIEKKCFDVPWEDEDFKYALSQPNTIAMVISKNDMVMGHFVYQLFPSEVVLLNLAVSPRYQRKGFGSKMVDYLKGKLKGVAGLRRHIRLICSDRNLSAHLFFKSCGFKADKIEHHAFGTDHDGYQFKFWSGVEKPVKKVKGKKTREQQQ